MFRIRAHNLVWAVALALIPVLSACGDDPMGPQYPEDISFAASLGIDLQQMTRLESGVYIQTVQAGEGVPVSTGNVTVAYTLWLPDGRQMESGEFDFDFGANQVIPGFEDGVSGMRVGEIRKIVIPSELGYGASGTSRIPPNTVLVFQVELLAAADPAA